jgi:hypothetical protein
MTSAASTWGLEKKTRAGAPEARRGVAAVGGNIGMVGTGSELGLAGGRATNE